MDDDVVGKMLGKLHDAIVEIEIAVFGAAAPTRALIPDRDLTERECVVCVVFREFAVHQCACGFFVFFVCRTRTHEQAHPLSSAHAYDQSRRKERAQFFE